MVSLLQVQIQQNLHQSPLVTLGVLTSDKLIHHQSTLLKQPPLIQQVAQQVLLSFNLSTWHPETQTSASTFALVLGIACVGGCLHGLSLALRKYYGQGHAYDFWLQWRWWIGAIMDAGAGFLDWPAMPVVSVQLLAPLIIVLELGTSYACGLMIFKEKVSWQHNMGIIFGIIGVIGIGLSTPPRTTSFSTDEFFDAWFTPRFLFANVCVMVILILAYVYAHRVTFFAFAAGVLEGLQFISSRIIADSLFVAGGVSLLMHPAVIVAACLKAGCILGILQISQLGLQSGLSRFTGIYVVTTTLCMCLYGTTFFGEQVRTSLGFIASGLFTLVGICLLNYSEEAESICSDGNGGGLLISSDKKDASPETASCDGDSASGGSEQLTEEQLQGS